MGGYALGIDLGTTYSAAAVHANGVTETVSLGHRSTIIPSTVFVTEDGEILVGEAAVRRGATQPERLCREFKRRLGDSVPLIVGGSPFSAEALSARLLRSIATTVAEQRGGSPDRIALTYPANWGAFKQERLSQAIRIAELTELVDAPAGADPVLTLTEPEAAAISYASTERVPVGETIAVYDLGGGTFDAAVLRKTEGGFEMLGLPEGIERMGGVDVDEAVYRHVRDQIGPTLDQLDEEDPAVARAVARLRDDCVEAKEALSSDTQVSVPVLLPNLNTEVRLTRSELEGMVRPVLEDTVGALRRAIASAGLTPEQVDRVLLVGGSSRMPLVGQMVGEALGRPFFVDAHPKHAVALGAALVAAETVTTTTASVPVVAEAPAPAPPPAPPITTPSPVAVPTEPTPTTNPPPQRGASSPFRGRVRIAAVAAAVLVLGVAAFLFLATRGGGDGGEEVRDDEIEGVTTTTTTVPPELALVGSTAVAVQPDGIIVLDDHLWVASTDGNALQRLDLASGDLEESFPLEGDPLAVVASDGSVWVSQRDLGTVARFDPATDELLATVETGGQPAVMAAGAGAIWVGDGLGTLAKIDPATNAAETVVEGMGNLAGIAVDEDAGVVWITAHAGNQLIALDAQTYEELGRTTVGAQPDAVAVAPSGVWVAERGGTTVSRVDPESFTIDATVEVGEQPAGLAVDGDRLWVIVRNTGTLVLVDGPAGEVRAQVELGADTVPLGVVTSPGRVWVTLSGAAQVAQVSVAPE